MLFLDEVLGSDSWLPGIPFDLVDREKWLEYCKELRANLRACPVFVINNVAEYFYQGTSQEEWGFTTDFPRPMPPFQNTWFEWDWPKFSNSNGKQIRLPSIFKKMGCYVTCGLMEEAGKKLHPGVKWKLNFFPFVRMATNTIHFFPIIVFGLDDGFNPLGLFEKESASYIFPGYTKYPDVIGRTFGVTLDKREHKSNLENLGNAGEVTSSFMYPVALAMSMLNCRNVITQTVRIASALVKKHARRGHTIQPSYHVIEIQPILKAIKTETGSSSYSRRAAAIMRGHFKDYSKGKGLFGKLKGMYWWEQRLTGGVLPEYRMKSATADLDPLWPVLLSQRKT